MRSQPWLGRSFILMPGSLRWGRYEIVDENIGQDCGSLIADMRTKFCEIAPSTIASTFEDLIHIYIASALPNYLAEVSALATLELARNHLFAVQAINRNIDVSFATREVVASRFEDALAAVFEAAGPLHKLSGCKFLRYQRMQHGLHVAEFSKGGTVYQAVFTLDLVLKYIDDMGTCTQVWCSNKRGDG